MKKIRIAAALFFLFPMVAHADYVSELRDQLAEILTRNAKEIHSDYFHDMSILVRKADEAELNDLATEIVKTHLLKRSDEYVQSEVNAAEQLYDTDRYAANKRLQALNRFKRYYEPTEDYLGTTGGQALRADMMKFRADAIEGFKKRCSKENLTAGLQTIYKAGMFITNSPEEIKSLQALPPLIECCFSFALELSFQDEKEFKTTYEAGMVKIIAKLKLQTNRRDYTDAKWVGEWIQHFDGRDGQGEGIAQAILSYAKGADTADLSISASRVTSVGRINFPVNMMGERRTLEVKGDGIMPEIIFAKDKPVFVIGCRDQKK